MSSLITNRASRGKFALTVILASTVGRAIASPAWPITRRQLPENDPDAPTFDWDSIEPSTELEWVDCYAPPLKCARLSVPLNYTDPDCEMGAVALISNPSPLADTPEYRGPILVNPGGPSASGVAFVINDGDEILRPLFGDEFDIIGFDPRAVGETTPKANWTTDFEEQLAFGKKFVELGDLNEEFWPTLPERVKELHAYAEESLNLRGDVLRDSVTENVARDMLSIVKAHGTDKLQYYGISYGSVLGSVFASLFPDNVGRLIIDGVTMQDGYYSDHLVRSVVHADAALEWFMSSCVEAGPQLCAFHEDTVDAVKARYDAIIDLVSTRTIVYPDEPDRVFESSHLQLLVFNQLYHVTDFGELAQVLAALEQGQLLLPSALLGYAGWTLAQTSALICSDTQLTHRTPLEMQEYAVEMRNITEYFPIGMVGSLGVWCSGWLIESDHFQGPLGANTSFPLLMAGNSADPTTPLLAAQENAARFPGSRLLTFDVPGHATISYAGNECVTEHFRAYMLNGTLPEEGAVCKETRPFFRPAENGTEASLRV